MANFGLSDLQIQQINHVFYSHKEIAKVVIYGSRAKNKHKNYSDIDLTLFGAEINLRILQKIETELDDILLPFKFDISIFSDIQNLDLIAHINQFGKVFYEK